jgi:hypothetical protein
MWRGFPTYTLKRMRSWLLAVLSIGTPASGKGVWND